VFCDFGSGITCKQVSLRRNPAPHHESGEESGAGRENRTLMVLPPRDFESRASTNSAIPAGTPQIIPHYPNWRQGLSR
jgi:hypothetical protein